MTERFGPKRFHESEGVDDWWVLSEGATTYFRTGSFAAGARLAQAISALDGIDAPGVAIDLRHEGVTVRLLTRTDDFWGMSDRDVALARAISATAREQGVAADPSVVQTLIVIPGAPVTAEVMPFWQAVLGYVPRGDSPDEDLVDPMGFGPGFWFEPMDEPRGDEGGAIHIAVWIPAAQAEARVAAALAAGGHLVRDTHAPAWWTLADSAGNEVDVATTTGRG